jgi:hypothetical protein
MILKRLKTAGVRLKTGGVRLKTGGVRLKTGGVHAQNAPYNNNNWQIAAPLPGAICRIFYFKTVLHFIYEIRQANAPRAAETSEVLRILKV